MSVPVIYINPNLSPDQFAKQQQRAWNIGMIGGFGAEGGGDGGGGE